MGSLSLVNKDGWVSSVWVHVGLSIFYVLLWWETINCQTCLHLDLLKVYSCYSCVHPWLYVLTFVEVVELNIDILNPFPTNNNLYCTIPAIKQDTNNIPLRNNPNNFQVNDGKEEFNKGGQFEAHSVLRKTCPAYPTTDGWFIKGGKEGLHLHAMP